MTTFGAANDINNPHPCLGMLCAPGGHGEDGDPEIPTRP